MLEEILSRLPIKGATITGGTSGQANYVPVLDSGGLLDDSVIPDLGVIARTAAEISYVPGSDPAHTLTATDVQAAILSLDLTCLKVDKTFADIPEGSRPTAFNRIKVDATTSVSGVVRLATQGEIDTGTDVSKVPTAATLSTAYLRKNTSSSITTPNFLSVSTPTATGHVTNKAYVDSLVSTSLAALVTPTGKVSWVDSLNGNDSTGTRGRIDKPFLTPAQALASSLAGDTIQVFPGSYSVSVNLLKTQVNWIFFPGCIITNTGSSVALFDDGTAGANASCSSRIINYGSFVSSAAGRPIINLVNASNIDFYAGSVSTIDSSAFVIGAGTNSIKIDKVTSTKSALFTISGGTNDVDIVRATYSFASGGSDYGITISGGTNFINIRKLTCDRALFNITGGTNIINGNDSTANNSSSSFISSVYVAGGTTELKIGKILRTGNSGSATHTIACNSGTINLVNCNIENSDTAASSTALYANGVGPTISFRNCEFKSAGTYSISAPVSVNFGCLGYNNINKPSHVNAIFASGVIEHV